MSHASWYFFLSASVLFMLFFNIVGLYIFHFSFSFSASTSFIFLWSFFFFSFFFLSFSSSNSIFYSTIYPLLTLFLPIIYLSCIWFLFYVFFLFLIFRFDFFFLFQLYILYDDASAFPISPFYILKFLLSILLTCFIHRSSILPTFMFIFLFSFFSAKTLIRMSARWTELHHCTN